MAYISTEEVKKVRDAIKAEFPNYKWSITQSNHSSLNISLLSADFEVNFGDHNNSCMPVNHYHLDRFYEEKVVSVFKKVEELMKKNAPYFDESDSMTDYFNCAYYYDFSIGKWDKPYVCKK